MKEEEIIYLTDGDFASGSESDTTPISDSIPEPIKKAKSLTTSITLIEKYPIRETNALFSIMKTRKIKRLLGESWQAQFTGLYKLISVCGESSDGKFYIRKVPYKIGGLDKAKLANNSSLKPGRLVSVSNGSCYQRMKKCIRHTLAKDLYIDIDIVNCHPTLLYQFFVLNGYNEGEDNISLLKLLKEYVENRDKVLEEIGSEGKFEVLKIINECGFDPSWCDWLKSFYASCESIRTTIYDDFPKYRPRYKPDEKGLKPSKSKSNIKGSTISKLMCTLETDVMKSALGFFEEKEIEVSSLCFDGCLIETKNFPKDKEEVDTLLSDLSDYIFKETHYRVAFSIKPMKEDIYLDEATLRESPDIDWGSSAGRAATFIDVFGDCVLHDESGFYVWDPDMYGPVWNSIEPKKFGHYMCSKLSGYYQTQLSAFDLEKCNGIINNFNGANDMMKYYSVKKRTVNNCVFNQSNPFILPISNGHVIDLRTLIERPVSKEDMLTIKGKRVFLSNFIKTSVQLSKGFAPRGEEGFSEEYNKIESFFSDYFYVDGVLDKETFECFKMILGYSITGLYDKKKLFVCYGETNSGKSSILNILRYVLGGSMVLPISDKVIISDGSMQASIQSEFRTLDQDCPRIAYCMELSHNKRLDEKRLKRLTGSDCITYRPFCMSERSFTCKSKIWIGTNEIPSWSSDKALEGRLVFLPFKASFGGNDIMETFVKPNLDQIFTWCCIQAKIFFDSGCQWEVSENMRALKTEIISESDDMMVFFEMYEPVSDIKDGTPSWLLWEQYQTWSSSILMGYAIQKVKAFERQSSKYFTNKIKCDRVIKGRRTKSLFMYKKKDESSSSYNKDTGCDSSVSMKTLL